MNSLITAFIAIAVVLIACAAALIAMPLLRRRAEQGNAPIAAIVSAIALPVAAVLFYVTVSNHDWAAPAQASAPPGAPTEAGALSDLVAGLEQRMAENPDDADGWLLLGRTYLQLQRLPEARRAFEAAVALEPSGDARLSLAEVDIMTDRANLAGDAGREVEKVLAEEPANPKALFYGGMVALARGDNDAVAARWRQLLAMSPPDNVRQLLEQQLAQLGLPTDPAGETAPMAVPAPVTAPAPPAAPDAGGFAVSVSIADELVPRIDTNAILFVLARRPGVPGPPIAAVRAAAQQLPVSLRISDANVMMEGQSLAGHEALELVARVSNGGGPVAASGDLFGAVTWNAGDGNHAVAIVIDQIVE